MLIPSNLLAWSQSAASLSRRVNANSQRAAELERSEYQAYQEG